MKFKKQANISIQFHTMAFTNISTNISVICREGANSFSSKKSMGVLMPSQSSSLKKNPKKMTTVVPSDDNEDYSTVATSSFSSASTGTAFEEEQDSKVKSKRRRRRTSLVRFTPGTTTDPELTTKQKNKRKIKKRRRCSSTSESSSESSSESTTADCDTCDSGLWWTKEELKVIRRSFIYAVNCYEYGSTLAIEEDECVTSLDRFSSRNRKRRKLVRSQMYDTAKAVQDFEAATGLSTETLEMRSQLLQMYSKSMRLEAIESALKLRASTRTRTAENDNANGKKTTAFRSSTPSDEMDAAMASAQHFYQELTPAPAQDKCHHHHHHHHQ